METRPPKTATHPTTKRGAHRVFDARRRLGWHIEIGAPGELVHVWNGRAGLALAIIGNGAYLAGSWRTPLAAITTPQPTETQTW